LVLVRKLGVQRNEGSLPLRSVFTGGFYSASKQMAIQICIAVWGSFTVRSQPVKIYFGTYVEISAKDSASVKEDAMDKFFSRDGFYFFPQSVC
jgi:hypothetical protein